MCSIIGPRTHPCESWSLSAAIWHQDSFRCPKLREKSVCWTNSSYPLFPVPDKEYVNVTWNIAFSVKSPAQLGLMETLDLRTPKHNMTDKALKHLLQQHQQESTGKPDSPVVSWWFYASVNYRWSVWAHSSGDISSSSEHCPQNRGVRRHIHPHIRLTEAITGS